MSSDLQSKRVVAPFTPPMDPQSDIPPAIFSPQSLSHNVVKFFLEEKPIKKKKKNAKNPIESFFTKSQKNGNGNICILHHNF